MRVTSTFRVKCLRFIPEYRILKYLIVPKHETMTKMSKNVGCTYGTLLNHLFHFQKVDLIVIVKKDGRSKRVELTKKGREISKRLIEIDEIFNNR